MMVSKNEAKRLEMNEAENIAATKKGFEASFKEGKLYDRQTQDTEHLERIIEVLHIQTNDTILDLGTGTGYVSFEIAKRYKNANVIGLDIVEKALQSNRNKAEKQNLNNIKFVSYNGTDLPFEDNFFDLIVTRYALHHFPKIEYTFKELARVIKTGGKLVIADPTPNEDDAPRFVDAYMRMKPDGHIKYYTKDEFEHFGENVGFSLSNAFQTEITFPRLKDTACAYDAIMSEYDNNIISGYQVYETQDGKYIYITQKVWNLTFTKV